MTCKQTCVAIFIPFYDFIKVEVNFIAPMTGAIWERYLNSYWGIFTVIVKEPKIIKCRINAPGEQAEVFSRSSSTITVQQE